MTSPTARVIASIWITVCAVSGWTLYTNYRGVVCERQFNHALVERGRASDASDALAQAQERAIAAWITDFSHPPLGSDSYGPNRLVWLNGVSERAVARFDALDKARSAAIAERRAHPLDLSCGK
jgi:hypothetical protein